MKAKYIGESWGISLTKDKIYECIGISQHGLLRIIDDTEEPYYYASEIFEILADDESEVAKPMYKTNKLLDIMWQGIVDEDVNEYELSSQIEDYVHNNFLGIYKENHELAIFFYDVVLDICEQIEPGLEGTKFWEEIVDAYNKIIHIVEEKNK